MTNEDEDFDESDDEGEDEEFAEYSPKSEFSKPAIVQSAVQKCLDARGVELKEGFFNYKTDNSGNTIKTWIPDSRKVYCSTVTALAFLLSPELRKSKTYKPKIQAVETKEEVVFEKYAYTEMKEELDGKRIKLVQTNRKYIPEFDSQVIVRDVNKNNVGIKTKGAWNHLVSAYWNEMVELSDEVFAILNELIDDLNYFKQRISF